MQKLSIIYLNFFFNKHIFYIISILNFIFKKIFFNYIISFINLKLNKNITIIQLKKKNIFKINETRYKLTTVKLLKDLTTKICLLNKLPARHKFYFFFKNKIIEQQLIKNSCFSKLSNFYMKTNNIQFIFQSQYSLKIKFKIKKLNLNLKFKKIFFFYNFVAIQLFFFYFFSRTQKPTKLNFFKIYFRNYNILKKPKFMLKIKKIKIKQSLKIKKKIFIRKKKNVSLNFKYKFNYFFKIIRRNYFKLPLKNKKMIKYFLKTKKSSLFFHL